MIASLAFIRVLHVSNITVCRLTLGCYRQRDSSCRATLLALEARASNSSDSKIWDSRSFNCSRLTGSFIVYIEINISYINLFSSYWIASFFPLAPQQQFKSYAVMASGTKYFDENSGYYIIAYNLYFERCNTYSRPIMTVHFKCFDSLLPLACNNIHQEYIYKFDVQGILLMNKVITVWKVMYLMVAFAFYEERRLVSKSFMHIFVLLALLQ